MLLGGDFRAVSVSGVHFAGASAGFANHRCTDQESPYCTGPTSPPTWVPPVNLPPTGARSSPWDLCFSVPADSRWSGRLPSVLRVGRTGQLQSLPQSR